MSDPYYKYGLLRGDPERVEAIVNQFADDDLEMEIRRTDPDSPFPQAQAWRELLLRTQRQRRE